MSEDRAQPLPKSLASEVATPSLHSPELGASRPTSVYRAGRNDPIASLLGDERDPVEVGIVVKHCESVSLGCGCDEKVGDLAPTLVSRCEHALHLSSTVHMRGSRLDELEDPERLHQTIPLPGASGRIADFEIADTCACEFTGTRS